MINDIPDFEKDFVHCDLCDEFHLRYQCPVKKKRQMEKFTELFNKLDESGYFERYKRKEK